MNANKTIFLLGFVYAMDNYYEARTRSIVNGFFEGSVPINTTPVILFISYEYSHEKRFVYRTISLMSNTRI